MFRVCLPHFNEVDYLAHNPDVKNAVHDGKLPDGYTHFLSAGIDEQRSPKLSREPVEIRGNAELAAVSNSGFVAVFGWLGDEGMPDVQWSLCGADFDVKISCESIFRYARRDVEVAYREGPYDYGFLVFGRTSSKSLLKQPFTLKAQSFIGSFHALVTPELASDKRLLDLILVKLTSVESHAGLEVGLHHFLSGSPGRGLVSLFQSHVEFHNNSYHVERFGVRPINRSFVTVIFGSAEPILLQPVMFKKMGIDFGEWIYCCNSPEDGRAALRIARLISELYDVMITVIVMTDNLGFGAANNIGVRHASSDIIYLINPDVYPSRAHADRLRSTLDEAKLGAFLWGGLLFYDDATLMHSGMYMERDLLSRCNTYQKQASGHSDPHVKLVRVEHFDKGVPFSEASWQKAKVVPAVSGAVMAFCRPLFEKLGGFSTTSIYGHYEDADLSLRWAQAFDPVAVNPALRLVHLEGQGAKHKGAQYRAAQLINRYLFSLRYNGVFDENPESMIDSYELDADRP